MHFRSHKTTRVAIVLLVVLLGTIAWIYRRAPLSAAKKHLVGTWDVVAEKSGKKISSMTFAADRTFVNRTIANGDLTGRWSVSGSQVNVQIPATMHIPLLIVPGSFVVPGAETTQTESVDFCLVEGADRGKLTSSGVVYDIIRRRK